MTSVEDRLRAATRAAADTVAPDSAPPLRLPGKPATHGPGFTVWRHRARWHRAVAPLAAAAAVIAVVAASVTLTHAMPPRAHSHRLPAGTVPLSTAPSFAAAAVPAYYVALEPGPLSAASTRAVVRATATGATLATVRPPRPYYEFTAVTVAADDRTFVLAAQQKTSPPTQVHGKWRQGGIAPARFFLLHLDPAHRIARLTALPISEGNGSLSGIALSPDGTRLAVAVGLGLGSPQEQGIRVITLRTGLVRTWTWRAPRTSYLGYLVLGANPLSWTADGRMLAFEVVIALPQRGAHPGLAVRLLDTTAPGRSLQSSRVVARFSSASTGDAMITPDGSRIVVPSVTHTSRAFTEYSTATGKRVAILGRRPYPHANDGGWPVIYWVSPSGGTLIAYDARAGSKLLTRNGGMVPGVLAVVSGGRFLPLPGSDSQAAW
jgi:hypothetical protein